MLLRAAKLKFWKMRHTILNNFEHNFEQFGIKFKELWIIFNIFEWEFFFLWFFFRQRNTRKLALLQDKGSIKNFFPKSIIHHSRQPCSERRIEDEFFLAKPQMDFFFSLVHKAQITRASAVHCDRISYSKMDFLYDKKKLKFAYKILFYYWIHLFYIYVHC